MDGREPLDDPPAIFEMTDQRTLLFGISSSGVPVSIRDAHANETYRCPGCRETLTICDVDSLGKQFAHDATSACTRDVVELQTARLLLRHVIQENAEKGRPISLSSPCSTCSGTAKSTLKAETFAAVELEFSIGSREWDVAAFDAAGNVRLAVGVLLERALPDDEELILACHWIELDAESVIAAPADWHAIRANLKRTDCEECKAKRRVLVEMVRHQGLDRTQFSFVEEPEKTGYVAARMECFRCHSAMPVFWWPGVPFCEEPPPEPRPRSVQFRYSKSFGGKYWVNTCPRCKAIQGDNFVFLGHESPTAPLKHLPQRRIAARETPPSQMVRKLVGVD